MRELSLKEIQKSSFEILEEIDDFCNEHRITYWVAFGTLIGAIRHKGFIPWDDDLDIAMMRDEYDKFTKLWEQEYKGKLVLRTRKSTKGYEMGLARICNPNYKFISTLCSYAYGEHEEQMGTFVDVYPFDNCGSTEEEATKLIKKCQMINVEFNIYTNYRLTTHFYNLPYRFILNKILHWKKGENWDQTIDLEIAETVKRETSPEDTYVAVPAWSASTISFKKEWFEEIIEGEFEGRKVPIPKMYDQILRRQYGNYMELPPEENRKPQHDYKIYEIE